MDIKEIYALAGEGKKGDVDAFIGEIKASGNPLAGLKAETFGTFLKDQPEAAKIFDGEISRRVEKGVTTWQEKNLDKLLSERYAKEHPEETPAEKRIKALEIESSESKRRAETAELKNTAIATLTASKIDRAADLANLLFNGDGQEPMKKVEFLAGYIDELVKRVEKETTERVLRDNGRRLETGANGGDKFYSVEQINGLTQSEYEQNEQKVMDSLRFHRNQ